MRELLQLLQPVEGAAPAAAGVPANQAPLPPHQVQPPHPHHGEGHQPAAAMTAHAERWLRSRVQAEDEWAQLQRQKQQEHTGGPRQLVNPSLSPPLPLAGSQTIRPPKRHKQQEEDEEVLQEQLAAAEHDQQDEEEEDEGGDAGAASTA
jgi:hypothetical protein